MEPVSVSKMGVLFGFLACFGGVTQTLADQHPLDTKCKRRASAAMDWFEEEQSRDYSTIRAHFFYSHREDTCILTEKSEQPMEFIIRDIDGNLVQSASDAPANLLHCNDTGADSVILDKVKTQDGDVANLPLDIWMDDGFGGLPRSAESPATPYSRGQCNQLFQSWLLRLE